MRAVRIDRISIASKNQDTERVYANSARLAVAETFLPVPDAWVYRCSCVAAVDTVQIEYGDGKSVADRFGGVWHIGISVHVHSRSASASSSSCQLHPSAHADHLLIAGWLNLSYCCMPHEAYCRVGRQSNRYQIRF